MNDIARLKLREIVAQYGFSIGDDPRLCESLLRDFCGEQRLEINILVGAVKQRVVADLLGSSGSVSTKLLFNQLAKRLYVNLGFAPDIAIWGVESWAFALGLISTQELSTGTPHIQHLHHLAQHQSAAAGQVQQGYQSTTSAVPSTSSTSSTSSEDVLRQAVTIALADGVIADAERAMLSDLAYRLGIPYSVSGQIFSEMDGQPASGTTAPLHFIWILDCSGSMAVDGKIQALNNSIREMIPHMQRVADGNPNAEVLVRVIKFSSGAQWHVSQPTPVADFKWTDLQADGVTRDLGKALSMVADQLKIPPMTDRALPPVLVLISDGQPTDDFPSGLKALMAQPWGKKAVRIAIAIGEDADLDVLQSFIGNPELKPLRAADAETLVNRIKWASTAIPTAPAQTTTPPAPPTPTTVAALPATPASPLLTVAQTGSCDYTTIGEAILEAEPGTQILVQPGLYRESLDIDKALEIIGNGRLADIIIESPDGSTPCITSSGMGSKLKGLTLRGPLPKYKLTSTFSVLDVAWGQLAIEDCDIHTGVRAVLIRNKVHLSMTNCIIRDFTEHGILALSQAQGIVQGCEIYNTPRRRTPGRRPSGRTKLSSGVVTSDTSNLSVLGCKIHDCTEHGIFASLDAQGIIDDCEIYNTPTGVKIDQTSYLTIRGCKIHDCTERGIVALGKAQSITQACEIYNTPEGVRIAETSKLSVLGCKIHDCTGIGIYALSKAQGIIDDCEIHNTPTGIRIQSTSNLNVRGCKIHDCVELRHKLNLYSPEGLGTRMFIEIGIVAFGKATGIIRDCEIYNTPYGVTMTNTSNLSLLDSKIHNCSKYAIEILELSHATVENCEIYSNGESGVQIAGTDHLTLLGCMIDDNGGVAPTVRDAYDFKVS